VTRTECVCWQGADLTRRPHPSLRHSTSTKALADTANVTDDFDGAASIEDDQVMQFVTSRSEIATASESASLLAGKGLADSASTGDSGSLRMQGYCDDSYFAETYLGTSITF
jgi:hypothetical protein